MTRVAVVGAGSDRRLSRGRARAAGRSGVASSRAASISRRSAATACALEKRPRAVSRRGRRSATICAVSASFDFLLADLQSASMAGVSRAARDRRAAPRHDRDDAERRTVLVRARAAAAQRRSRTARSAGSLPTPPSSARSFTSRETIVAPGHVRQSGGLRYVFGDPGGGCGERTRELIGIFDARRPRTRGR